MAISDLLNRRVRAHPEDDHEEANSEVSEDARDEISDQSDSEQDPDDDDSEGSGNNMTDDTDDPEDDPEDDEESDGSDDQDNIQESLNNISFGALAKAQSSLGPKKSKRTAKADEQDQTASASPLDDIRARILEAREQKRQASAPTPAPNSEAEAKTKSKYHSTKEKRSSKHAPMVQSTRHAVTRKRTVIEPPTTSKSRDPRFDPTVVGKNGRMPAASTDTAYSFLNDYRTAELKDLKEQLAKTRDPEQKESLKKAARSAMDRLRETENRKREQSILADHKKHEKEMIRDGKKSNPYYLKKSDLKKEVLLRKYNEMNSKDRAKALERRRKKMASKERLQMPFERRGGMDDGPPPSREGGGKRRRVA